MTATANTTQTPELTEEIIKQRAISDLNLFETGLYRKLVDDFEKPYLEEVMRFTNGNQSKAALKLNMNRATLRSKLKRHGLL